MLCNEIPYPGFEQAFLSIACLPSDMTPVTTHKEIDVTNILSLVANLTPFSDYNQSPRNMYQCQMLKQTMVCCLLLLYVVFLCCCYVICCYFVVVVVLLCCCSVVVVVVVLLCQCSIVVVVVV